MIIIGSTALAHHGIYSKTPKDLDIIRSDDEIIDCDPSDSIFVPKDIYDYIEHEDGIASIDSLYTIKCSHLCIDHKWNKHKNHALLLQHYGASMNWPLYYKLQNYWLGTAPARRAVSLDMSKQEFFTDKVTYVMDHDKLHELVSYPKDPIYQSILADGAEVLVDKNKFDKLTLHKKLLLFREEITVIAIERWLINPHWKGKVTWGDAYVMALKKTILSLTKGWARDFIIDNLNYYNYPDYTLFDHALQVLEINTMKFNDVRDEICKTLGIPTYEVEDMLCYFTGSYKSRFGEELDKLGFEVLQQEGGGEGGAENCTTVFTFKGTTYRVNYKYYSYDGFNFYNDDLREVKPVTKTITVYE